MHVTMNVIQVFYSTYKHNKSGPQCWNERIEEQGVTEVWSLSRKIQCTKGGDVWVWMGQGSSPPEREGPCSWAADESWPADRGPSTGGRCYCVWELHTTEESPPLTNVSFGAPCAALSVHNISDNAAELITCMYCRMFFFLMHPCGTPFFLSLWEYECISAHASPVCFPCCPLCVFYLHEWVLQLHRELSLYE